MMSVVSVKKLCYKPWNPIVRRDKKETIRTKRDIPRLERPFQWQQCFVYRLFNTGHTLQSKKNSNFNLGKKEQKNFN